MHRLLCRCCPRPRSAAVLVGRPRGRALGLTVAAASVCPLAQVLHYQWFADFGNADAARAVAHMLSHGVRRDHVAAVKYLRQVRPGNAPRVTPRPRRGPGAAHSRRLSVVASAERRRWRLLTAPPFRLTWLQAAEAGDADAMAHLGHIYANGIAVEQARRRGPRRWQAGAGPTAARSCAALLAAPPLFLCAACSRLLPPPHGTNGEEQG